MPSRRSIRSIVAALAVVMALAVFVPPLIKLTRFRRIIVESISGALGRQVSVREVTLRLFPQPGFALEGFVVQDDPSFSAEPLLHAEQVTASLRWTSLWRWRPEIGTLTVESPTGKQPWSLNVVRRQDGRWNLQELLLRASQTPAAPTTKPRPEARLRFPYLEGEGGRINFKFGMEKKAYALSEADFALWLASENEWNLRLSARPMRTDANLTDTGLLEVSGAFGRASRLEETPVRLRVSLRSAQLGQLTRLVYGRDRGWRGSTNLQLDLTGTPEYLQLSGTGSIDDFRRYDIIIPDTLRLALNCTAEYHGLQPGLFHLDCRGRNDALALRGRITNLFGPRQYDLALVAREAPMAELARLARHAKFAMPSDLTASGTLDAELAYRSGPGWTGKGSTSDFVLRSGVFGRDLELSTISFEIVEAEPRPQPRRAHRVSPQASPSANGPEPGVRLALAPFLVPLGGAAPATVRALISTTDYNVAVGGEAELQRLFRVARGLGLQTLAIGASGSAKLDLQIAGSWSGFTPPLTTGAMQLRNVTALLPGVHAPIHVRAGNVVLLPDERRIENLSAAFVSSHISMEGSVVLSRACNSAQRCPVQFDLHSSELSLAELNQLLNPRLQRQPWYRLLAGNAGENLDTFQALGRVRADRAALDGLELQHVALQAELRDGKLRLSDVRAETLGGKLRAQWRADLSGGVPQWSGSGTLERIDMQQVAALTHHPWATGAGSGTFKLELAGWNAAELAQSAGGSLDFDWQNGTWEHASLASVLRAASGGGEPADLPLRLKRFAGRAVLHERRLDFQQSRIETADGIYTLTGTASLGRLELRLMDQNSHGYAISGTVEKPHVAPLSMAETQAALGK